MLHLLFPPLLFESAFAIDWHIFSKVFIYALFLALPGLIVATLLTGFTYLGLYGWPWEACMLLGGILSATDPVAVVALLREMGVKKSLATLIEAESLLNDGTAVVVYSILLKAVHWGSLRRWLDEAGHNYSHIGWMFVRMSVIGKRPQRFVILAECKWSRWDSAYPDANPLSRRSAIRCCLRCGDAPFHPAPAAPAGS